MTLPIGTLVQIKESALDDNANSYINEVMTTENGWLWFVEYITKKPNRTTYECRSLATGETAMWFDYELEAPEQEHTT
jgi:hypothetical protein